MSDEMQAVLEQLSGGAILWDNFGLYGFPVVECAGGFRRVKRRDFNALVRRGLVALGPPQPIDCPGRITDAGRAALRAAAAAGRGEG